MGGAPVGGTSPPGERPRLTNMGHMSDCEEVAPAVSSFTIRSTLPLGRRTRGATPFPFGRRRGDVDERPAVFKVHKLTSYYDQGRIRYNSS